MRNGTGRAPPTSIRKYRESIIDYSCRALKTKENPNRSRSSGINDRSTNQVSITANTASTPVSKGDPNNPEHFKDDAMAEELRAEIERRLNVLQEAGILELKPLATPDAP
jgi:hypothetical protein